MYYIVSGSVIWCYSVPKTGFVTFIRAERILNGFFGKFHHIGNEKHHFRYEFLPYRRFFQNAKKSQTFANRRCKIHHGSLCFTFRIQAHRRPARSHRSPCKWLQRGQSVPDPFRCHRLRKDLHHGECHRAAE